MSFIDSLTEEAINSKRISDEELQIKLAVSHFVSELEGAIKTEATKAAENHKHMISGFCVKFHEYECDPWIKFVEHWEDSKQVTDMLSKKYFGCANIYRIDRVEKGFFETRYGGGRGNLSYINVSDTQIRDLCYQIEKMVMKLGFTQYSIKPVCKQFYKTERIQTHGFFGVKTKTKKHDDGIGQVLYIEIKW